MLAFLLAHLSVIAAVAVALLDFLLDVLHPNPSVTNVINWVLPFLRKEAGQS